MCRQLPLFLSRLTWSCFFFCLLLNGFFLGMLLKVFFSDELHAWLQTASPRCFSSHDAVYTEKGLLRVQLNAAWRVCSRGVHKVWRLPVMTTVPQTVNGTTQKKKNPLPQNGPQMRGWIRPTGPAAEKCGRDQSEVFFSYTAFCFLCRFNHWQLWLV